MTPLVDILIKIAKMPDMKKDRSPIGTTAAESRRRRSRRAAYRAEQKRLAPYEEIARIVIQHRMALGLSQQELAERMGTSHSAISRIESGQHKTSVETLRRLADALELRFVVGFESGSTDRPVRELVTV
jgi:ribosome-binding protein aMBF1 (putative translation factor)